MSASEVGSLANPVLGVRRKRNRFALVAFSWLLFLGVLPHAFGVLLADFEPKPGARIGVMIGTFDPPHLGHDVTVRNAIQKLGLDYVILIPNSAAIHKPDATPHELRLRMAQSLYADAPNIVVPNSPEDGNPLKILKELRRKYKGSDFIGIFGDDLLEKNLKNRATGYLSKKHFRSAVIQVRQGTDPSLVDTGKRLWGLPTLYDFSNQEAMHSSSEVRKYLMKHPEAYDLNMSQAELERIAAEMRLDPKVLKLIQEQRAYLTVRQDPCARFFRKLAKLLER